MQAPKPSAVTAHAPGGSLYALYVVALAACLIGNLMIRLGIRGGWLPAWAQVSLAVLAALPLIVAAVLFWRFLRRDLDEMLQRMVLEGLAFALTVFVPLAALYVNMRATGAWTPRLDAPEILLTPALLVALGIALARRRYE